MLSNPYSKYKTNSVNTATKEKLTLMLYDGCIKFMNLAKLGIQEKNIEKSSNNLLKAQAIISELDVTLDMDIEIAKDMHILYDFALSRLVDANLEKNEQFIDDAKYVIVDLRDAWKEAMEIARKGN